jgi:hypothetical protein
VQAAASLARSPSKARVSINLQDNEISLERTRLWRGGGASGKRQQPAAASSAPRPRRRSVEEVLREVGADIIGLQNVRAEEEHGMRPLSELAEGLGMRYVFAESWAPEYGNAVLSRWPIKRWKAHRVADQSDFRSVSPPSSPYHHCLPTIPACDALQQSSFSSPRHASEFHLRHTTNLTTYHLDSTITLGKFTLSVGTYRTHALALLRSLNLS